MSIASRSSIIVALFLLGAGPALSEEKTPQSCAELEVVGAAKEASSSPCVEDTAADRDEGSVAANAELPSPAPQPGMTVHVDPASGRFTPIPSRELQALVDELQRMVPKSGTEGLVERSLPGGGVTVDLDGRFQSYFLVEKAADGSLKAHCIELPAAPGGGEKP